MQNPKIRVGEKKQRPGYTVIRATIHSPKGRAETKQGQNQRSKQTYISRGKGKGKGHIQVHELVVDAGRSGINAGEWFLWGRNGTMWQRKKGLQNCLSSEGCTGEVSERHRQRAQEIN